MNQANGIPIITWHNNRSDQEFEKLTPLLLALSWENDVRKVIQRVVDIKNNCVDFYNVEGSTFTNLSFGSLEEITSEFLTSTKLPTLTFSSKNVQGLILA